VRHALIALSSIHLDFVTTDSPHGENLDQEMTSVETLAQYDKAVRQLRRYLSSKQEPSIKVALICCALFYSFESTRGNYDSALAHLQNGLTILREAKEGGANETVSETSRINSNDLNKLEQVFSRMDLQATLFDDGRMPYLEFTSIDERTGATPIVNTDTFENAGQAQLTLDKLQNQAWRFITTSSPYKFLPAEGVPTHVVDEKKLLVDQYKCWSRALDGLWDQQSGKEMDDPQLTAFREAATMLKLLHRTTQMLLLSNYPNDSTIFGSSPNKYGMEIIELVESLRLTDPSRRTYSSEAGIVVPLTMLVSKCADFEVCGKALLLLASSRRREGLVDAQMVFGIAERLMALRGRAEELPPMTAETMQQRGLGSVANDNESLELWASSAIKNAPGGLHAVAKMLGVQV
jgi:Fungal specific transcription factor domain